ncbi:MAG: hypothetical protein QGI09_03605, partial [Dehalococcoidia bacterium]|nr:hypothetical protein [Dehalococcoidia bacterium]
MLALVTLVTPLVKIGQCFVRVWSAALRFEGASEPCGPYVPKVQSFRCTGEARRLQACPLGAHFVPLLDDDAHGTR